MRQSAENDALPPMLADRGPCLRCGVTMRACALDLPGVCCPKCEHGRVTPPADERDPTPCPRCGEVCKYDGWSLVHANGIGIDSCPIPPAPPAPPEPPRVEGSGA